MSVYAHLFKVGRTSMQYKIEVWTTAGIEEDSHKAAEGLFTFVAIDANGKPQAVDR